MSANYVSEDAYNAVHRYADMLRSQLDSTLQDRAIILRERDATFARMLERVTLAETALALALYWQSLHEWEPPEGTWAMLWPGYYGPFTAMWFDGEWSFCDQQDLANATMGLVIDLPHLATDRIPTADREEG